MFLISQKDIIKDELSNEKLYRYKKLYMDIAVRISDMSYAQRLKVGAILVKNDNIISFGWNGMPRGFDNVCEIDDVTRPEVIHAEENMVMKLARDGGNASGATAFITHQPCMNCSRMLHGCGIKHVVFLDPYRDISGVEFLKKCNVTVEQLVYNNIVTSDEITNNLFEIEPNYFNMIGG